MSMDGMIIKMIYINYRNIKIEDIYIWFYQKYEKLIVIIIYSFSISLKF